MAKFQVGDLVDVRFSDGSREFGWLVVVEPRGHGDIGVSPSDGALVYWPRVDDCIPHVPAPVVPPAPVDPLTGLTAAESERRHSARLLAFGRGEADPFAAREANAFLPMMSYTERLRETCKAGPKDKATLMFCEHATVSDDGMIALKPCGCAPPRYVEPRALTIEDVKVGSRWVDEYGVEVAVLNSHPQVLAVLVIALTGPSWQGEIPYRVFFKRYKPAP